MTGKELEAWRQGLGLSRAEASQLLACGVDYLYAMERQGKPISELRARVCWLLQHDKVRQGYMQHIGFVARKDTRFARQQGAQETTQEDLHHG